MMRLAQEILKPGISVYEMLRRVRVSVHQKTNGKQTPMSEDMLLSKFYFNGSGGVIPVQPTPEHPRAGTYEEPFTGMEFVWVE